MNATPVLFNSFSFPQIHCGYWNFIKIHRHNSKIHLFNIFTYRCMLLKKCIPLNYWILLIISVKLLERFIKIRNYYNTDRAWQQSFFSGNKSQFQFSCYKKIESFVALKETILKYFTIVVKNRNDCRITKGSPVLTRLPEMIRQS